ncbi:MAG: hypothetical protein JXR53_08465 [Bacteroidales bacterium]|nr:hypothetical protein [Bacteroidales bacterium]
MDMFVVGIFLLLLLTSVIGWIDLSNTFPGDPIEKHGFWGWCLKIVWFVCFVGIAGITLGDFSNEQRAFNQIVAGLLFGKFFWSIIAPELPVVNQNFESLKDKLISPIINTIVWGTIFVISTKIFSLIANHVSIVSEFNAVANDYLNLLADVFLSERLTKLALPYEFSLPLYVIFVFIAVNRVFYRRDMSPFMKILTSIGFVTLTPKLIKYSGMGFNEIVNWNISGLLSSYSVTNISLVFIAWAIPLCITTIKSVIRNN